MEWRDKKGLLIAHYAGTLDSDYPRVGEVMEEMKGQ